MSLLLLLCEHRQVPQIEDFFSNFPLNFSPPNPEFQITRGGWRSGWTAFGPEPSASQVSTPPSCFFTLVVFRGGGFCYCCGSGCQRPTGGAESPDKVAARGRIKPRLLTLQWRVLVPPDVPVEGLSHRRSASTVCWPLTNSLTVRLRPCPAPPPAVTIYSLCRAGAGKLYRLLGHNGF